MSNSSTYQYQRPSTMATRSLLASDQGKPIDEANSDSSPNTGSTKPGLQRRTTDNYERAAAEASNASSLISQTSIGAATAADALSSDLASAATESTLVSGSTGADRPGLPTRKSWRMSDFKGQQQGHMLAAEPGHGYSTTAGK